MTDRERIERAYNMLRKISYNKYIYELNDVNLPIKEFSEVLDILDVNYEYILDNN